MSLLAIIAGLGDVIQFCLFAGSAAMLVTISPAIWFLRLLHAQHDIAAVLVAACWGASVFVVVREMRNRAITAVSAGIVVAWLITLAFVFPNWLFWWCP